MIPALVVIACGIAIGLSAHHCAVAILVWRQVRAIRGDGMPTSLDELAAWYPPEFPGPNAAPVYREAFAELADAADGRPRGEADVLPIVGDLDFLWGREPLTGELLTRGRQFLAKRRRILALLHKGADMPGCRHTVDWSHDGLVTFQERFMRTAWTGFEDSLFLQEGVREAVRLLCLKALVSSAEGLTAGETNAIRDAVRVTHSLDSLPMLMTHLVTVASGIAILDSIEYLLKTYSLNPRSSSELNAALAALDDEDALRRAYVGERCFGLTLGHVSRLERIGYDQRVAAVAAWAYDLAEFSRADGLYYLKVREKQIAAAEKLFPERRDAFDKLSAELEKRPAWRRRIGWDPSAETRNFEVDATFLTRLRAIRSRLAGFDDG